MVTTIDVIQDEPERERLMLAVGEAITQFATVEITLVQVYATMLGPVAWSSAWATLEAAMHFETKLRILRAVAARRKWPDGFKERFANLINKASKRGETRNKVAHWMVSHFAEHTRKGPRQGYVLMSPNMANPEPVKHRLSVKQVEEFALLCGELSVELMKFGFELAAAENSAQKTDDVGG